MRTVGVVYDPLLDELFSAVRGEGARMNGRPLSSSAVSELGKALVATGFAYDVRRNPKDNVSHFLAFLKQSCAVRRDGSAALDLCYVAAGRLDGFWELRLHAWDVAAGLLIVEEASIHQRTQGRSRQRESYTNRTFCRNPNSFRVGTIYIKTFAIGRELECCALNS